VPTIQTRGFFYTTELCFYAEQAGEVIVELRVVLNAEPSNATSTMIARPCPRS
jgi:hypothetical protein